MSIKRGKARENAKKRPHGLPHARSAFDDLIIILDEKRLFNER